VIDVNPGIDVMLCCFQDVGIHYRVRQEGAGKAILRFLAHPAVRHCCCARRRCCATQLIAKFLIRQPELSHVGDSNLRETLRFVETPFLNASQSSTRRVKRSLFQKKNGVKYLLRIILAIPSLDAPSRQLAVFVYLVEHARMVRSTQSPRSFRKIQK
jgi:hypothetical protein